MNNLSPWHQDERRLSLFCCCLSSHGLKWLTTALNSLNFHCHIQKSSYLIKMNGAAHATFQGHPRSVTFCFHFKACFIQLVEAWLYFSIMFLQYLKKMKYVRTNRFFTTEQTTLYSESQVENPIVLHLCITTEVAAIGIATGIPSWKYVWVIWIYKRVGLKPTAFSKKEGSLSSKSFWIILCNPITEILHLHIDVWVKTEGLRKLL